MITIKKDLFKIFKTENILISTVNNFFYLFFNFINLFKILEIFPVLNKTIGVSIREKEGFGMVINY